MSTTIDAAGLGLEQVTPRVFTTTSLRGCNPSFVVTSAGVVHIDTPQLPTKAVAMRAAAEAHGPIRYLINTEHHVDHIFGNHWYRGAGEVVNHQALYDIFMDPGAALDPFAYALEAIPTGQLEAARARERGLEVELRLGVRGVERDRLAEAARCAREQLAAVLVVGDRVGEAERAEEVRRPRPAHPRVIALHDVREPCGRLVAARDVRRVGEAGRLGMADADAPDGPPHEEVVLHAEQAPGDAAGHRLRRLPQRALRRRAVAHVVVPERGARPRDVERQEEEPDPDDDAGERGRPAQQVPAPHGLLHPAPAGSRSRPAKRS